jgi:hypothetical protein
MQLMEHANFYSFVFFSGYGKFAGDELYFMPPDLKNVDFFK